MLQPPKKVRPPRSAAAFISSQICRIVYWPHFSDMARCLTVGPPCAPYGQVRFADLALRVHVLIQLLTKQNRPVLPGRFFVSQTRFPIRRCRSAATTSRRGAAGCRPSPRERFLRGSGRG